MWYKTAQTKKLILMRGLPGSGKSTRAKELAEDNPVFSTDDFFYVNNEYQFDPSNLARNHQKNIQRTEDAMKNNQRIVTVDNTNISPYEMKPYVLLADKYGYQIEIHKPNTDWAWNSEELAKRNTHKVPQNTIEKLIERFDENEDLEYIRSSKAPWEN